MVDAHRKKMTQRGKRWCTEEEEGADKERRKPVGESREGKRMVHEGGAEEG